MKNFIRKIIPNSLRDLYQSFKYSKKKSPFVKKTPKEVFTEIYTTNHWDGRESISGHGSDNFQVQTIIASLSSLIADLKIKSILDIPCGDFYWMQEVNFGDARYIGGDIVKELIDVNVKRYAAKNIEFKELDLISGPIPSSELIINRDCLVHFSYDDIYKSIQTMKASSSKYLLTTTFTNHSKNYDINTGDWRPLNFQKKPFNFPDPIQVIVENCVEENATDKSLALYLIDDIPLPKLHN